MNTFGIDYQPDVTMIALREQGPDGAHVASVGDGVRAMIPNAASSDGLWASRAVGSAQVHLPSGAPRAWIDEPGAQLFWSGLYGRLYSYLGRLAPLRRNGYRTTVALQDPNYQTDAHAVAALARVAGFDEIAVIPGTHALLCRCFASPPLSEPRPRTVVTIAVGETSTLVGGFHVEWDLRGLPTIRAASLPSSLEEAGYATWNRSLLELLRTRLTEEPPEGYPVLLRDAAIRYAVRLSQADAEQPVQWRETLEERLYAPLSLTYAQCAAWPESVEFARRLPEAIRRALTALGSSSADLLVVGGIGSIWPFAQRIAATLGPVWWSGAAADDIAVGATWWGELCEHPSGTLLTVAPSPETAAVQIGSVGPMPTQPATFVPPWERRGADVD